MKSARNMKNDDHSNPDDAQRRDTAPLKENTELEEKFWSLLGKLEAASDEESRTAVREKIWRLVKKGGSE